MCPYITGAALALVSVILVWLRSPLSVAPEREASNSTVITEPLVMGEGTPPENIKVEPRTPLGEATSWEAMTTPLSLTVIVVTTS